MSKDEHQELLSRYIKDIQISGKLSRLSYQKGQQLYEMGHCHLLTSSPNQYAFKVTDEYQDFDVQIQIDSQKPSSNCSCQSIEICSHAYAAFLQTHQELSRSLRPKQDGAIKYSREGMIKRVLKERQERAKLEHYHLEFADNIYGEHLLKNAQGKTYQLSFYNFEKRLGYCSCIDYQTNKLETCKHLMFAFDAFDNKYKDSHIPQQTYPFLEIFRHPLHNYQISWFYPHQASSEMLELLEEFFDEKQLFKAEKMPDIHQFLEKIQTQKSAKIRPEVIKYISSYFDEQSLRELFIKNDLPSELLTHKIYPFQKEGIQFIGSKKGCILADEIGLGKTVQAIGAALFKAKVLGFRKVNILCPEPLIEHWKTELNKWVPDNSKAIFILESFNQIMLTEKTDFLIIDEAQKIDDYSSSLLDQLYQLSYNHILLITDSRIESSLMKFYAMAGLINQYLLTPLWELSYQHCLYDAKDPEKVVGYYNIEQLHKRLHNFYLRRNKSDISTQIPNADKIIIPVALDTALQAEQSKFCTKAVNIMQKKSRSQYDHLQLKSLLKQLLRLGQYTINLVKRQTYTPKLKEFQHFISHKLHLNTNEKVIIFVDELRIQEQIKRLLQNHQKSVQIIGDEQQIYEDDIQFYITRERLQKELPAAKHILYFHIPYLMSAISRRQQLLNDGLSGIKQNNIYIFKSAHSLESIWYQWMNTKPYLMQQITDFLSEGSADNQMSLRLLEELIHVLKSLIIHEYQASATLPNIQMDLFLNETSPPKTREKTKQPKVETDSSLNSFFIKLKQSIEAFENLDKGIQDQIKTGEFQISKEFGNLIIRIKPIEKAIPNKR
jgi:SNF2 family DNA or RNA helicase